MHYERIFRKSWLIFLTDAQKKARMTIVVVYIRLLASFKLFFFYDKILQAPKSTKSTKRY